MSLPFGSIFLSPRKFRLPPPLLRAKLPCAMRKPLRLMGQILFGLRFRLLLLVALACAPLVIWTYDTAWEDRRKAMAAWRQRPQKIVELAAQEEQEIIGRTRQLLLALAKAQPIRAHSVRNSQPLVEELFRSDKRYASLGVINTNLEVLATAPRPPAPLGQTEREFFLHVMATRAFAVADFPVEPTMDRPTVTFGCPVLDWTGQQVVGAVSAALDLNWFNPFNSELAQLPKAATWTEMDRNGKILVRSPATRDWAGQPLPERSILKTVLNEANGVVEASDADGVPTVYAFATRHSLLFSGNVVTLVSIPEQVLFAATNHALVRNLTGLGVAGSLALLLGWFGSSLLVLRPVKALVRSSSQLASGDLSARTGLPHGRDELGRLTLAFDRMAHALELRELQHRRATEKVQDLSQRLVSVQETERRSIARELHDEIGQTLTVAEMNLQAALQEPGKAELEERLERSIQAVERVLEQVHDISLNLRPSMLDDLGLEPALRWYTNRQADLTGLQAEFRAEPLEHRVDPVIETECFRVGQEALTNVVRHAQARSVAVELTRKDGFLHLFVRDDGAGFDVAAVRNQAVHGASLGVLSMEERATLAGGGLKLNSAPGQGTEVHAWFPLKWQTEDLG